jgi:hypothetical protein
VKRKRTLHEVLGEAAEVIASPDRPPRTRPPAPAPADLGPVGELVWGATVRTLGVSIGRLPTPEELAELDRQNLSAAEKQLAMSYRPTPEETDLLTRLAAACRELDARARKLLRGEGLPALPAPEGPQVVAFDSELVAGHLRLYPWLRPPSTEET